MITAREPETGGEIEPTPIGLHLAVCYGVIDIGHQDSPFSGTPVRQVILIWELPRQRIDVEGNSKPRAQSKFYRNSLHKKADLRKHLERWRGKRFTEEELRGFDLQKLLGIACQLQIGHNDNGYAVVETVVGLPSGVDAPKAENPLVYFSFEEAGMEIPGSLPDWIADKIRESYEYRGIEVEQPEVNDTAPPPEDIPF